MSGLSWSELSAGERARVEACFSAETSMVRDLVRYSGGVLLPRQFAVDLELRIRDLELREDDIWIVTYPKCGTHWTQADM